MLTATQSEWMQAFRGVLVTPETYQDVDDQTYTQLQRMQEYVLYHGVLPTDEEVLRVLSRAVEFYWQKAVPIIGEFPKAPEES